MTFLVKYTTNVGNNLIKYEQDLILNQKNEKEARRSYKEFLKTSLPNWKKLAYISLHLQ
jgi:hypothetical protein